MCALGNVRFGDGPGRGIRQAFYREGICNIGLIGAVCILQEITGKARCAGFRSDRNGPANIAAGKKQTVFIQIDAARSGRRIVVVPLDHDRL
ncbi:hypothetical protein SDC9_212272 [bioreactor metagenome]|uniref:Uncharacterized protein n=1 Tax=bioreactor metagenome TaxID=1076179 RepID=A0A645JMD1_9ZZZZ